MRALVPLTTKSDRNHYWFLSSLVPRSRHCLISRLASGPVASCIHNATMTPISGPFSRTQAFYGAPIPSGYVPAVAQLRQGWYRQVKPYDTPLVYNQMYSRVSWKACSSYTYGEYYDSSGYRLVNTSSWATPDIAIVYNKAYSKLLSKLKENTAELGAGFAEFKKTAEMVNNRSFQLWQFMRAVRRGRFGDANFILNIPPGFRPKAKGFGGAVLEYSFGWAPTVGDIYSGLKVLTGGVPPGYISVRASSALTPTVTSEGGSLGNGYYMDSITGGRVLVTCGCIVRLTNPNLWLANQLGLINPASVVWELIPFSFLVDYIVNVGDVLNGWSDFLGVDVIKPYRSFLYEVNSSDYKEYGISDPSSPCYSSAGHQSWRALYGQARRIARDTSLPGPSLRLAAPRVSLTRASTSISLLLQLLKGK